MRVSTTHGLALAVLLVSGCGRVLEPEIEIDGERLCTDVCEQQYEGCQGVPLPEFYTECPGYDPDRTSEDCFASCMDQEDVRGWDGPCAELREIRIECEASLSCEEIISGSACSPEPWSEQPCYPEIWEYSLCLADHEE